MIQILGRRDVGEQPRTRVTTCHRAVGGWRLGHLVAMRAGQAWAHMTHHPQGRRHVFQHLGHVLADHTPSVSARGAIRLAWQMFMHLAGQVCRQRFAGRCRAWRLLGLHINAGLLLAHPGVDVQLFEFEFQLLDLLRQTLRAAPEEHTPQLLDEQRQALDLLAVGALASTQCIALRAQGLVLLLQPRDEHRLLSELGGEGVAVRGVSDCGGHACILPNNTPEQ